MRFLLYNIRYGAGIGRRFHFPVPCSGYLKSTNGNLLQIVAFMRLMKPDIIGLLEVDSGSFRSGRINQAEAIAAEMKHYHVYQSKYSCTSLAQKLPLMNRQGNAFLTNQKIHSYQFHYFREGIKRLVIELELEGFTIFLVHLSLTFRHRQSQLQDLYAMVKNAEKPVMVAGDFNVFWGDGELQSFLASTGLKSVNGQGKPSYPSRAPKRQLDYIFRSPEIHITKFMMPHVKLSDHVPLVCDFEVHTS